MTLPLLDFDIWHRYDDALVTDEEDLIELSLGEPENIHPGNGGVVAVEGSFPYASVWW